MQLLVGELNSSHSGVNGPPRTAGLQRETGTPIDRAEYEKNGVLKIVDGQTIGTRTNIDELLSYRIGKQTALSMRGSGGSHDVSVVPVNAATAKRLLYRRWVEDQRACLSKISGGRLGYVHMFDMRSGSLDQLQADLDADRSMKLGKAVGEPDSATAINKNSRL